MTVDDVVGAIHAAPCQMVLAVTGGGSQAIADVLAVPGGSRTLLEAIVPYADRATDQWLGAKPEHYCSERTARLMAMAAYRRAQELTRASNEATALGSPLVGLGATASLASDRPKRGPHRLHVAVQTAADTRTASVEFVKGARSRRAEERLAADVIVNLLAEVSGVAPRLTLPWRDGEQLDVTIVAASAPWQELLGGRRRIALGCGNGPDGDPAQRANRVIMPGSFNPRHAGHRQMAAVAARRLGRSVEFELSMWNVDKPPLDYIEIQRRLQDFSQDETVWLTRAPTFVEKCELFPRATFVVGADTMVRIGQPQYYGGQASLRDEALAQLAAAGAQFLVFGRVVQGCFETLDDLDLPAPLRALCTGCDETEFRCDLSSTELRRRQNAD